MQIRFICCLASLLSIFNAIVESQEQISWSQPTVQGFGISEGKLDYTEGIGAYLDLHLRPNTKNFDNGGGSIDLNTEFLYENYGVKNTVYDPYQRSKEHNQQVLSDALKNGFDTTTSNSVLNVIDSLPSRLKHIWISCMALKKHGVAYFRVYEGNGSDTPEILSYGYQSHRPTRLYQEEVESIFEKGNVVTDVYRKLIIAYKNNDCKDSVSE
jgi:hypothetical protein